MLGVHTIDIRLADGNSDSEGRVELVYGGAWGTICLDDWDHRDTAVLCRQLGYVGGRRLPTIPGHGHIWLSRVQCTGEEEDITECAHSDWTTHQCSHQQDVTVACYNRGMPTLLY